MFWAILVSLVVLGITYLIRNFVDEVVEFRSSFFVVIGIFFILYIGAAIFVSYNLKSTNAEIQSSAQTGSDATYSRVDPVQNIDLTTGP